MGAASDLVSRSLSSSYDQSNGAGPQHPEILWASYMREHRMRNSNHICMVIRPEKNV